MNILVDFINYENVLLSIFTFSFYIGAILMKIIYIC